VSVSVWGGRWIYFEYMDEPLCVMIFIFPCCCHAHMEKQVIVEWNSEHLIWFWKGNVLVCQWRMSSPNPWHLVRPCPRISPKNPRSQLGCPGTGKQMFLLKHENFSESWHYCPLDVPRYLPPLTPGTSWGSWAVHSLLRTIRTSEKLQGEICTKKRNQKEMLIFVFAVFFITQN